jgi:phage gp29-like protein
MTTLELEVSSLPWTVVPMPAANGKPRKSEQKLAAQVQAAIRECSGWSEMVAHLIGEGELHGHATSEMMWGIHDGSEPLLRGWMIPQIAKNIAANRFGFRNSDGRLVFDPNGRGQMDEGIELVKEYQLGKFVQHCPRVNGDVAAREGLDRLVAWAGIFRNHGLKGWLLESENAWKPTRLIEYTKGASKEDIAFAKQLAAKLTTTGGAAYPETLKPTVEYPKATGQSGQSRFRELEEWLGMELSKAILGHTLLLESGSRGARSLGEVGYKMAQGRRDARAIALAVTLNALLVRPLVAYNQPSKRPPLLLPEVKNEIDLVQFSTAVDSLAKRMRIGASWVREQARIPEPQANEEILSTGTTPDPIGGGTTNESGQADSSEPPPGTDGEE